MSGIATPRRDRPRAGVLAVWLLLLAVCGVIAARATYVADLTAFLPVAPTAEQRVLLAQLQNGIAARVLFIGVRGGEPAARLAASKALGNALRQQSDFESVLNGDTGNLKDTGEFLFAHRYLLSPAVDAERFTVAGLRAAFDDTVALLGTPAGSLLKPILWRDPTGETVRMSEVMLPSSSPRVDGGVWVSRTQPRALLIATTRATGSDLDAQSRAIDAVRHAFDALKAPGVTLELSGQGVFSVDSRASIEREIHRLAAAGTVAVIALLWFAFGSVRALGVGVLPVASGIVGGVAVVALGFGHVHAITLGFGTTLIGEAVDYAIYYLIQARPAVGQAERGRTTWLRESWPTVRLGLLTSIAGFAALMFSGFPGLQQLGVFSIAGLTAAALTTRFVLPELAPDGSNGRSLAFAPRLVALMTRARWPLAVLTLGACVLVAVKTDLWRSNLMSLSPVSAEALALDASLRGDIGAQESSRLVSIDAPDEQAALERAEAVGRRLDALVVQGRLAGYESPARLLPSLATQKARQTALPDEATLRQRLTEATAGGPLPAARMDGFIADVQAQRTVPLLTRESLARTPLAGALQAQITGDRPTGPRLVLMTLQPAAGAALSKADLLKALDGLPDTRVVEIESELASLYAHYLQQALWLAVAGAVAVLGLLFLRLRSWRRLLRVAVPLAASVVIVMGMAALADARLGVLHLVGLLLVVAVGSNYALFFDHLREAGPAAADVSTLGSLLLANVTMVISFGLLALASVPALSAVGRMVAPGTFLALVLSAAFIGAAPARRVGQSAP